MQNQMQKKQKKQKNVSISMGLLALLCNYFLNTEKDRTELEPEICAALKDKSERMHRRELYWRALTAKDADEREQARQEYLDEVGIPQDFRH